MFKTVSLLGLCVLSCSAFANQVTINNADFDAQNLSDGAFTSGNVQGWATISGSAGIYNPPASVLTDEGGSGFHTNTLYLNGNSVVSQTLNTSLAANTDYSISFDVGDRLDTAMPNYIVRIKVAGNTVFNAINPVLPQTDGSFETVNLTFNSGNNAFSGSLMTIELEATGSGQVNLDNFAITATANASAGNSQFGEWEFNTYSLNAVNQAQTDGFIVYYNWGTCSGNQDLIRIGDTSSVPNYVNRNVGRSGMLTPVKKDQYWKVERYVNNSSCGVTINFLPLNP